MEDFQKKFLTHPKIASSDAYLASSDNTVHNVITEPATSFHQRKEPKN